jgi:Holliday junction resolvase RusA-like endonuclease
MALEPGAVFFSMVLRGDPKAKGRHRSRIIRPKNGPPFISQYPDPATAAYEKVLAQAAALRMRGQAPSDRPLYLLVVADIRVPKSWSKRDTEAALSGSLLPTSRPDADNYGKIVDALNGIVWADDSQVVDCRIVKRYSAAPAMTIEVREFY